MGNDDIHRSHQQTAGDDRSLQTLRRAQKPIHHSDNNAMMWKQCLRNETLHSGLFGAHDSIIYPEAIMVTKIQSWINNDCFHGHEDTEQLPHFIFDGTLGHHTTRQTSNHRNVHDVSKLDEIHTNDDRSPHDDNNEI